MNIDSVGKIRPPRSGEGQVSLLITDNKRVHGKQGGVSHSFHLLYHPDSSNQDVFSKAVQPLLDLFIAGFNTCIILYGESGSGKSYTMAGEQNSQPGIVPHAINYIMSELQNKSMGLRDSVENPQFSGRGDSDVFRLLMYQYEIYNEVITDLMATRGAISGRGQHAMELQHSAEEGTYIKNLEYERCRTPAEGLSAFWQSWLSRNTNVVDFGPVKNFSTVVFQLDLTMMTNDNPLPNRSKFTVIRMPGMEKLSEDLSRTRLREGPTLSKSVIAFNQLSADLARQQEPERVINYGESKLTSLLEDTLGGNCKTRVICCLPPTNSNPDVMSAILTGCGLLTEVKNYPILNDSLAQNLITQYRTRIDASLQHGGFDLGGASGGGGGILSRTELQDQLLKITTDNTQLRERNDRLFQRLEQVQEKLTDLAKSKSELSTKLVASEEDKLKVSKGLVELQLENNRLSEEYEAENFDLKNKILSLENQLVEFELQRNKFSHDHDVTAKHTRHLEESRKQIADEFVQLKTKTLELQKDLERQVKRNDEMRNELAKLIDTEAALLDLRHNVDKQREVEDAAVKELERAKNVLRSVDIDPGALSARKQGHANGVAAEVREMRDLRHDWRVKRNNDSLGNPRSPNSDLLGNYKLLSMDDDVVKNMKSAYDEQTNRLEKSLLQLRSQLTAAYETVRAANKKCAEQSAAVTVAQDGYKKAKDENIELQQKIKESNQEYRKRMWKYVQDIAEFMSDDKPDNDSRRKDTMKKYIDGMMKDMKSAFRSREEQLSNTARNNRKLAKNMLQRHERLLISYRAIRAQLESIQIATTKQGEETDARSSQIFPVVQYPIDLGPDDSDLSVDEKELQTALSVELNNLRQAMKQTKNELKITKNELNALQQKDKLRSPHTLGKQYPKIPNISDAYKNVQEYTKISQAELEKERAELLTRATVAEQQIAEQQEYISSHLARYKQEILRLRKILSDKGINVGGRISPDPLYSQRFGGRTLDPYHPHKI
uniref:coiled-coil domain-containing protein 78-like n=1 Tax=Styela clava TaxID=7725 RepID=UPI0019397F64|nr:coiled-coil domain-containing protein 78-like [Styela clava]